MKKFKFPLDTVLDYKQQVLDALRGEHGAILAQVRKQEDVLEGAWQRYRGYNEEYRERKASGLTIREATLYEGGLRALELEIARETEKLEELRRREEEKREQVVEAKKETSSLEKLKEKKLDAYQKAVQKSEETLIDEFISAARANSANAVSA